jgi:CHAD domain-containing protein
MAYRLKIGEPVQDGIRRIIIEQIERALGELNDKNLDRADTVHQVRKRCKKIRAALRLVREALGKTYSRENARYRDAARRISKLRDAEAVIETCDALASRFSGRADEGGVRIVRARLAARKKTLVKDTARIDSLLKDFESAMIAGRESAASLAIEGKRYEPVLAGMQKTYARARRAMKGAYDHPAPGSFHEWRKRVKYHWYHMRLAQKVWSPVVRVRRNELGRLGEALGNHHNLCVFCALLMKDPAFSEQKGDFESFIRLAEKWTARIERESKPRGVLLFAEKPGHLVRRFSVYFSLWQKNG